mgnify:CR=1
MVKVTKFGEADYASVPFDVTGAATNCVPRVGSVCSIVAIIESV